MDLATLVYEMTQDFPAREHYGLAQQLRRAAASIPSNLAEGHGRGSAAQKAQFTQIAKGSLFELETQLELATRLGFVSHDHGDVVHALVNEVGRTLIGLHRYLSHR